MILNWIWDQKSIYCVGHFGGIGQFWEKLELNSSLKIGALQEFFYQGFHIFDVTFNVICSLNFDIIFFHQNKLTFLAHQNISNL